MPKLGFGGALRPSASAFARGRAAARRRIPLPLIQRHSHAYLFTTGTYLQGTSAEEIIGAVHDLKPPMLHARSGLRL
jgi:hypothetical protein